MNKSSTKSRKRTRAGKQRWTERSRGKRVRRRRRMRSRIIRRQGKKKKEGGGGGNGL